MIDPRRRGHLPGKPHTVFRDDQGRLLYEHCFTRRGFDGPFSMLYHRNPPQQLGDGKATEPLWSTESIVAVDDHQPLRRRHYRTFEAPREGTPATGRKPLLFNGDLTVGIVRPEASDLDFYFANGDADDLFYIYEGSGELRSWFGNLCFGPGDYVVVPRGVVHRFVLGDGPHTWLWLELRSGLRIPKQYRNDLGQLRMDAPYTHRDFRAPELDGTVDPGGPREVVVKRAGRFTRFASPHKVLDVVGWDGTVYPFVFPIRAFSPKAGQVHLPPTVHGTFATARSLVCSFVPRMVDFGEDAVPSPYPHSNVDVDEVIFYVHGEFLSRRGIGPGSVSFHPAGVPHGPQPGAYEASIGKQHVDELAVMVDTFEPLRTTMTAVELEDVDYDTSWWPQGPSGPGSPNPGGTP